MLKRKISAYLSGPIRGFAGKAAPKELIELNLRRGAAWEKALWLYFGNRLNIYCPHTRDVFPQVAMDKGYLTVDQVLDIDCEIVKQCDVLLVANWEGHISEGMAREIDAANKAAVPVRVFTDIDEFELKALEIWLNACIF